MVNMQKTFLFAKTFSNFFNKIGRQYPYGVLAVLKKNCLTDYSLLTIHTGIVIMTFELSRLSERKLIKSGVFIKKVGITFYKFSENPKIPAGNAEQKVGITFFLKQI